MSRVPAGSRAFRSSLTTSDVDTMTGMVLVRSIGGKLLQHGKAVDIGHLQVEHNHIRMLLARPAQPIVAVVGLQHLVFRLAVDDLSDDVPERLVVIDHQHPLTCRSGVRFLGRHGAFAGVVENRRNRQCEDGALADDAFKRIAPPISCASDRDSGRPRPVPFTL